MSFSTRCRVSAIARLPPAESPATTMFFGSNPQSCTRYRYAASESRMAAGYGFAGGDGAEADKRYSTENTRSRVRECSSNPVRIGADIPEGCAVPSYCFQRIRVRVVWFEPRNRL